MSKNIYVILNRIITGTYTIEYNKIIRCRDLTEYETNNLRQIFNNTYKDAINKGLLGDKEVIDNAISEGKWKLEYDIDGLKKQQLLIKDRIRLNKFKYDVVQALKQQLIKINKEITKLESLYNSLFDYNSARFMANLSLIYQFIEYACIDSIYISSREEAMKIYSLLDAHTILQSDIRRLARNSVWYQKYQAAKNHLIPPIFPDILNITNYQSLLLMWSSVYEYAFNHMESPSNDIIEDDDTFDKWLEDDRKKSRNYQSNNKDQEVFIVSDKKGAKDVYEMNTSKGKQIIDKTVQIVKQKGKVSEFERIKMLGQKL